MGRSKRKDVDYFPFYIKDGRTLFVLENKYQCKGTGFFTNLMRFLSRTPDHHFQIKTASDRLYFFASVKCDEESGMDMIKMMVETEKLDRVLWVEEMVLASKDFLESVQDAYRKRSNSCITLIEIRNSYGISSGSYPTKKVDNGISSGSYPQSKVKESKVKESKEILLRKQSAKERALKIKTSFDFFWANYPRKKSKGQAEKVWNQLKPNEQLVEIIISKIGQAKTSKDWIKEDGQFIPYPATWLRAKGWEDEYAEVHQRISDTGMQTAQMLAGMKFKGEK